MQYMYISEKFVLLITYTPCINIHVYCLLQFVIVLYRIFEILSSKEKERREDDERKREQQRLNAQEMRDVMRQQLNWRSKEKGLTICIGKDTCIHYMFYMNVWMVLEPLDFERL